MRKGEEFKAPRYASAAVTRDYITTRNIIPNNYLIIFSKNLNKPLDINKLLITVGNNITCGYIVTCCRGTSIAKSLKLLALPYPFFYNQSRINKKQQHYTIYEP